MINRAFAPSFPPRDLGAARYLDFFIVGGVSAVLMIRFVLRITHYPSLGGAKFHIAHMLWGGLLLAVGLLISLSFLGNRSRLWAALLGGIGFGTFIDEIGKFITRDNNYFYQPSVALIYVTFVLIYLAFRDLQLSGGIRRDEYLVNAIHNLEEAVINDLQQEERDRALRYLAAIVEKDELTSGLAALIERAQVQPKSEGLSHRIRIYIIARYGAALARSNRFGGLTTLFILHLAVNAGTVALAGVEYWSAGTLTHPAGGEGLGIIPMSDWLLIGSTVMSAVFVSIAVIVIRRSRITALHSFHRAVLISICFTEVFMFYRNQYAALAMLAFNLFSWACVNVVITRESRAGPEIGSRRLLQAGG